MATAQILLFKKSLRAIKQVGLIVLLSFSSLSAVLVSHQLLHTELVGSKQ